MNFFKLELCDQITDKDERKAYDKAYREKNKDKIKAYNEANKDKIRARLKAYREKNKDKIKAYNEANKDKIRAQVKAYSEKNKDKRKAYREANKDKKKAYNEANKDKIKAQQKAYRIASKIDVFSHYSKKISNSDIPICSCCGYNDIRFLNLDHIKSRKNIPQKEKKLNGIRLWKYIKSQGYPDGYQVMCFNCNIAKGNRKYCPHQLDRMKSN